MPEERNSKKIEPERVSNLLFDDQNFRFSEDASGSSQKELLKILDRDFEPLSIGESLVDNGYFAEEPLVIIPKPHTDKFIVIEGNRRLAALRFLSDEKSRELSIDKDAWEALAKRLKTPISQVPVVKYESRDELTTFLGYRHIAGILKWDPFAKARFINSLVDRKGKNADFRDVARETGSKKPTIRDNYIAYRILQQAREDFGIDTKNLEKNFSVFYRSLSDPHITKFIGLNKDRPPRELKNPISLKKRDNLEELIGFIHGTGKDQAVLTDSRQLTKLGEVLNEEAAYKSLRISRNLEQAYQLTGGEKRRLLDNLERASYYLDEALRDVHRHKGSPKVVSAVRRCAGTIVEILDSFPNIRGEIGIQQ
jgi:hypothetical protein